MPAGEVEDEDGRLENATARDMADREMYRLF
jgi:hypothetical protein